MQKIISFFAVGLLAVSISIATQAADDSPPMESTPAAQSAMQTSQTTVTELADGSRVEIAPDQTVSLFAKDGTRVTPSDGTLTLKDGSTITIKDGKKV